MRNRSSDDFDHVLRICEGLAADLPGHVFIGGVAVYLHSTNNPAAMRHVEVSHDADVVVSLVDFSILRDVVEVVSNRRLGKHQVVLEGVDVDVYVERQHRLSVPYDELVAHSVAYGPVGVACPEHLLVLKLAAYADRRGSTKGDKDERDVVRLATMGGKWRTDLAAPYLGAEHAELLQIIARGRVFAEMCGRNEHEAKKLKKTFEGFARRCL
jgi:hypothetical protein